MPHPTRRNQPGLPSKPKAPEKLSDQIDQIRDKAGVLSKVIRFYEEHPKLATGLTVAAVVAAAFGLFDNDKKG